MSKNNFLKVELKGENGDDQSRQLIGIFRREIHGEGFHLVHLGGVDYENYICLNPLYRSKKDGQLHVSGMSVGPTLSPADSRKLRRDGFMQDQYFSGTMYVEVLTKSHDLDKLLTDKNNLWNMPRGD